MSKIHAFSLSIIILSALIFSPSSFGQNESKNLSSPDKNLIITFQIGSGKKADAKPGQLFYSVTFKGKNLFDLSALGLDIAGSDTLGSDMNIMSAETLSKNENYDLVVGKTSKVREAYNEMTLNLQESASPNRKLTIVARAYNDAVAFRYVVPDQQGQQDFKLKNENTEFHFSKDATTYAQVLPHYRSMYESEYLKLPVSAFSNQGGVKSSVLLGLPLLAEVPGAGWVAIAEADLRGYSSMYLTNPSGGWSGHTLLSRLSPLLDSSGLAVTSVYPVHTPWRIIMVADNPGKIIESNAVMNLTPQSAIENTSWIKPGKASWDWWSGSIDKNGKSAYTTENMKYYVDFAAKSGFEYMLLDAGWSGNDITKMNGKVDIPELVKYAGSKHVKVWIWLYAPFVMKQMEEAFPLYEKWGVAGVKIDFVERDDQQGIEFYYKVSEQAAAHHLMIDFHGCTKPFGLERTYPNVMNYEAVLGMEQSKGGTRDNPGNHAMLPFTRMLTGPLDYTPGGFDNVTKDSFISRGDKPMVMGTRTHHLALYVVYQAPFEMVSDYPAAYEGQPEFQFIKQVPASWDQIKVLNGIPGEFVTIARRKENNWYIGSITDWQPRTLQLPLFFLDNGKYMAEIYADAPDADRHPKHTVISKQQVDKKTVLKANLVSGGGYSVRIIPVK